jgi:hypothetical protein
MRPNPRTALRTAARSLHTHKLLTLHQSSPLCPRSVLPKYTCNPASSNVQEIKARAPPALQPPSPVHGLTTPPASAGTGGPSPAAAARGCTAARFPNEAVHPFCPSVRGCLCLPHMAEDLERVACNTGSRLSPPSVIARHAPICARGAKKAVRKAPCRRHPQLHQRQQAVLHHPARSSRPRQDG